MRYDTVVTFHNETDKYDANKGEHVTLDDSFTALANVTDIGTNRAMELFGALDTENLVLRLMAPVVNSWSYLTFYSSNQRYVRVTTRTPLKGNTLIVGESHG